MPPKRSASKPRTSETPVKKKVSATPAKSRPCKPDGTPATETTNADDGLVDSGRTSPVDDELPTTEASPAAASTSEDEEADSGVVRAHIDPTWRPEDLVDLDTDAVISAEVEDEIAAFEREISSWRENRSKPSDRRNEAATAQRVDPSRAEYLRRTSINNAKGVFTFDTLVANVLSPEVRKLGADAIAEELVRVKTARLDSVAMESADVLECLDAVSHLYLSDNRLRSLNSLEFLGNLRVLVIAGNEVESLLPIAGLELEMLDARSNRIETLVEDGCCVIPLTVRRLYLEGNPCVPDAGTTAHDGYVQLVRETCPELICIDDTVIDSDADSDVDGAEADDDDGAAAARGSSGGNTAGLLPDEVDFDIEAEEERFAAANEVGKARFSLPVDEGLSSNVRAMTDDLLRRYEGELDAKLKAIKRANDAANIGGRAALREQEALDRAAMKQSGAPLSARPGSSAGGRPSSARGRPESSSGAAAPAADPAVPPRPGSASGRGSMDGSVRASSLLDAVQRRKAAQAAAAATPPVADDDTGAAAPSASASRAQRPEESDSDDSSEDEAYTGVRPHAETVSRQHELNHELRFALGHQCNVAMSRINDMWDSGASGLQRQRDASTRRFLSSGGDTEGRSAGFRRALEQIRDRTGKSEGEIESYKDGVPAKKGPTTRAPEPLKAPPATEL